MPNNDESMTNSQNLTYILYTKMNLTANQIKKSVGRKITPKCTCRPDCLRTINMQYWLHVRVNKEFNKSLKF